MLTSLLTGYPQQYNAQIAQQTRPSNAKPDPDKNDAVKNTNTEKTSEAATVNKKTEPPKRNDATVSSNEQASRFSLSLSLTDTTQATTQQRPPPPPPPQGQGRPEQSSPANMILEQLNDADIDTSNFDAELFDDAMNEAISSLNGLFPDKDTMQSLIMNTLNEMGVDTQGFELELPDRPPPPPSSSNQQNTTGAANAQTNQAISQYQVTLFANQSQSATMNSFYA
jgi:hypothetical protein